MSTNENTSANFPGFPKDRTGAPDTAAFTTADQLDDLIEEAIGLSAEGTADRCSWINAATLLAVFNALPAEEKAAAGEIISRHQHRLRFREESHAAEDRTLREALTRTVLGINAARVLDYLPAAAPAEAKPFNSLNFPRNRNGAPIPEEIASPYELDSLLDEMAALSDEGTAHMHSWINAATIVTAYTALPEYARQEGFKHLTRHLATLTQRAPKNLHSDRTMREALRAALPAINVERIKDISTWRVDMAFTEIVRRSLGEKIPTPTVHSGWTR